MMKKNYLDTFTYLEEFQRWLLKMGERFFTDKFLLFLNKSKSSFTVINTQNNAENAFLLFTFFLSKMLLHENEK